MRQAGEFQLSPSGPVRAAGWAALAFLFLPLLVIVPLSFSSAQFLSFPPPGLSLRWYAKLFGSPEWLSSMWVSLQVASLSAALTLILGTLASIALVRTEFRGKAIVFGIFLAPMIVPAVVTTIGIYFLMAGIGLAGTVLAIAIGHSVIAFPIVIVIVTGRLQDFDMRLEHAAISLGASQLTAFRRITCPIIAPALLTSALFTFLSSFDEVIVPLFLGGPYAQTLSVRIWNSIMLEIEPTVAAVSTVLIGLAAAAMLIASLMRGAGEG
jgi:putative spermidine/putrescine transport system permease protein